MVSKAGQRGAVRAWGMARVHSFNACYQLLCISLLFRNSRKPPRLETGGPSVAFHRICLVSSRFVYPLHFSLPSSSCSDVLVPAASYPTRCFINENEGASYIFLTRGVGRLLSSILFSFLRGSLFLPTLLFLFSPTVLFRRGDDISRNPPPFFCSPSVPPFARGGNITFRVPDQPPGNATTSFARN